MNVDVDLNSNRDNFRGLLRRWWRLLFIGMVLSVAITAFFVSRAPQLYRARVALLAGSSLQSLRPEPSAIEASASLAHVYADLSRRPLIMQAVIDDLHLSRQPESLARQVTAQVRPDSQVLELAVVDTNPRAAQAIAGGIAEALIRATPASKEDVQAELAFAAQQLDEVQRNINDLEAQLRTVEGSATGWDAPAVFRTAEPEAASLRAMLDSQRATYADLLSFYQLGHSNVLTIVEPAGTSVPISKRTPLVLLAAALGGLLLTAGGIAVSECLDDTLRWRGPEQRTCLGLPVLGALATVPSELGPLFFARDPSSPEAEALRDLRASIHQTGPKGQGLTLLLTSPTRRDGKTFLAANLAAAAAASGSDVLLVDANLRRPALHEILSVKNEQGLSDALVDKRMKVETHLGRIVRPARQAHLWVITAGREAARSSLALLSPRLPEMLRLLKRRYQLVIVDGPAEGLAPDAGILASLVDATVMVVRAGSTGQEQGWRCKQALARHPGANLAGVVFNQVPFYGERALRPTLSPQGQRTAKSQAPKATEQRRAVPPAERKSRKAKAPATPAAKTLAVAVTTTRARHPASARRSVRVAKEGAGR